MSLLGNSGFSLLSWGIVAMLGFGTLSFGCPCATGQVWVSQKVDTVSQTGKNIEDIKSKSRSKQIR